MWYYNNTIKTFLEYLQNQLCKRNANYLFKIFGMYNAITIAIFSHIWHDQSSFRFQGYSAYKVPQKWLYLQLS